MGLFSSIGSFFGGPLGGLVGDIFDDSRDRKDAENANSATAAQSQAQRDWQEKMRGSAYQATVSDLQQAGLNPMLAYSNGPTSAGTGANSAPMQNKGLQASQTSAQSAQSQNIKADTVNKQAQTEQIEAQTRLIESQIGNTTASTGQITQQTENLKAQLPEIQARIGQLLENKQLQYQQGLTEIDKRNLMNAQQDLAKIEYSLKGSQITYTEAQTATQKVLTKLRSLDIPGAENTAKWEKNMGMAERATNFGLDSTGKAASIPGKLLGGVLGSAAKAARK